MVGLPASPCRSWSTSSSYIPWALIENHQLVAGLAARPHRPDAARPDRPDVRLPQQPDRRRTRRRRRGGPGRSTSSPSGSTRRASPAARRRRSTTPATSSSGGSGIPAMAFVAWHGVQAPEPGPGAHRDRLRGAVDPVGADRPGGVPVPLLHGAAVRGHGPGLLRRGAVARRVAPRPGRSPGSPAAVAIVGPAAACGCSTGRCAAFVGVDSVNPGSQACPAVIPEFVLTAQTAGAGGRRRRLGARRRPAASPASRPRRRADGRTAADGARSSPLVADRPPGRRRRRVVRRRLVAAGRRDPHPDQHPGRTDRADRRPSRSATWRSRSSTARDARRFVVGLRRRGRRLVRRSSTRTSAPLPLPSAVVNAYQGILPTYLYAFQFPVSTMTRERRRSTCFAPMPLMLGGRRWS